MKEDLVTRRISLAVWLLAVFLMAFASPVLTYAAPFAYITDASEGHVYVIDLSSNSVVTGVGYPIPVGSAPIGIAVSPATSRAYVANYGDGTVSVINTSTNLVIGSPIPVGSAPLGIAVSPTNGRVYVANQGDNINPSTVSVIDPSNNNSVTPINVGVGPTGVAIDPAGFVYVTNTVDHTVSVIDTSNTVTTINIAGISLTAANPFGIAVNPAGTRAYVANQDSSVTVIDITASPKAVMGTITLVEYGVPHGIAVSPDGKTVYVANNSSHNVAVINVDGDANTEGSPIDVVLGNSPYGIQVNSNGNVYVCDSAGGNVSYIIGTTVSTINSVGTNPRGFGNFIQLSAPSVTTTAVTAITSTTATGNGTLNSNGGATITGQGVCYGTAASPVLGGTGVTCITGTLTGTAITASISGLTPGQLYHVQAYATNSVGRTYGGDVQFTASGLAPSVTTTAVTAITSTTATGNGTLNSNGGVTITDQGVCYGTAASPVLGGTGVTCITGTLTGTAIAAGITGLTPGQLYHVQAYATNSVGRTYGGDVQFTALTIAPSVTTTAVTSITSTTATGNGTLNSNGGATITDQGVCYGTAANPILGGTGVTCISGTLTGTAIAAGITGLTPGQLYHVQAYATNLVGRTYGGDVQFTALTVAPSVTTTAVTSITSTTATGNGTLNSNGGATITDQGVCYGTAANPILGGTGVTCISGTLTGTAIAASITGLTPGQLYHVQAYATNSVARTYGGDAQFTASAVAPSVTTTAVTSITSTTATGNGTLNSNGGATITDQGVCYGTAANPVLGGTGVTCISGTLTGTAIAASITGLTPGQLYHVQAYATNSVARTYGGDAQFTASAVAPSVTTTAVTSITSTTATGNGTLNSNGGATITDQGVCYGTAANPILGGTGVTCISGTLTGTAIAASITGLTPGQLYHVQAYATNSVARTYGGDAQFTTLTVPSVTTTAVTSITSTTATGNGTLNSNGGATITDQGVCYGTAANPVLGGTGVTCISGTLTGTAIAASITGLTPGQLYHVQAYATNSVGKTYGGDVQFTALTAAPSVTTTAVTSITSTTATGNGTLNSNGGATITDQGVCYGTAANPILGGTGVTCISGTLTGTAIAASITGLTPGQLYHVQAYATNSVGRTYGGDAQFTALAVAPSVTTTAVTSITSTTATGNGTLNSNGGATITDQGVCYGTAANPVLGGTGVTCITGTLTGTAIAASITGLTPGQLYHVQAYATNSVGRTYGGDAQFTTLTAAPSVTTTPVTSITSTTATGNGTLNSNGGATITDQGVCYGTAANPVLGGTGVTCITGTLTGTAIAASITGLTPGQLYHVQAYATNSVGRTYGGDAQFTTLTVPSVTTTPVTSITSTTATGNGTLNSNGGATITDQGVCYGTAANPVLGGSGVTCIPGTLTGTAIAASITGLTPGQLYHVQAYATNSVGRTYGGDVQFTTLTVPSVTTTPVTSITSTTATGNGTLNSNGGATITDQGVCYGTAANPVLGGSGVTCISGTLTGTAIAASITGLTPGQLYHVQAYATNSVGRTYGGDVQVTTLNSPAVTTTAVTSIHRTSATLNGNVTSAGGATVSARGVCYSTAANPVLGGSGVTCIAASTGGTGTFNINITGLTSHQTYHVQAYATNSVGTSYGGDVSFTAISVVEIGVFRGGNWYLDYSGTYLATGTWAGCGAPADPTKAACIPFGTAGDIQTVGDWNGDSQSKIGVFRGGNWYLDYSGTYLATGTWAGCGAPADPTKAACIPFGTAGDIPAIGDWNGDGKSKIGVFRNGMWYLDYSGTYLATGTWAGCGAPADPTKAACIPFGTAGDIPAIGDWNGDGKSKIGVFRNGMWYLDYSGTYLATGTWAGCGAPADPTKAACIPFGTAGDIPAIGDWNGGGKSKIGVFRNGMWYLDYSGTYLATGTWAGCGAPTDPTKAACIPFGTTGDIPVVGDWNGQ